MPGVLAQSPDLDELQASTPHCAPTSRTVGMTSSGVCVQREAWAREGRFSGCCCQLKGRAQPHRKKVGVTPERQRSLQMNTGPMAK